MSDRSSPLAWAALIAVNAVLAVGAAIVAFPVVVLVRAVLAERGWTSVDPTLIDDGLDVWVMTAVVAGLFLAAVAVPSNLLVARRTALHGRTWRLVALFALVGGGLLINRWTMPSLW